MRHAQGIQERTHELALMRDVISNEQSRGHHLWQGKQTEQILGLLRNRQDHHALGPKLKPLRDEINNLGLFALIVFAAPERLRSFSPFPGGHLFEQNGWSWN